MDMGALGGLLGGVLGVLGGIVGTYFSIRNTHGRKERSFMIRMAVLCWAGVTAFLVCLFVVPPSYNWVCWLLYAPALVAFIRLANRGQARIQRQESEIEARDDRA